MKQVIIIAPFRNIEPHVGNLRVDRFVSWLKEKYSIVLLSAGPSDEIFEYDDYTEIMIKDPLRLYPPKADPETQTVLAENLHVRKPNELRRRIAFWIFNPDPSIIWAKHASVHELFLSRVSDVHAVISTSPPESSHEANYYISKKLNCRMIVDLRDGWFDDPLKTYLLKKSFRSWRENCHRCAGYQEWREISPGRNSRKWWRGHFYQALDLPPSGRGVGEPGPRISCSLRPAGD